jgi:hypothetical protein
MPMMATNIPTVMTPEKIEICINYINIYTWEYIPGKKTL